MSATRTAPFRTVTVVTPRPFDSPTFTVKAPPTALILWYRVSAALGHLRSRSPLAVHVSTPLTICGNPLNDPRHGWVLLHTISVDVPTLTLELSSSWMVTSPAG